MSAKNIRRTDFVYHSSTSDGKKVDGTERECSVLFNDTVISPEEIKEHIAMMNVEHIMECIVVSREQARFLCPWKEIKTNEYLYDTEALQDKYAVKRIDYSYESEPNDGESAVETEYTALYNKYNITDKEVSRIIHDGMTNIYNPNVFFVSREQAVHLCSGRLSAYEEYAERAQSVVLKQKKTLAECIEYIRSCKGVSSESVLESYTEFVAALFDRSYEEINRAVNNETYWIV